jgi:alpha-amylase
MKVRLKLMFAVVEKFLGFSWNRFVRPSEVMIKAKASELPTYRVDQPISWADIDRDVSAWRDNDLQYDTLRTIYELEPAVRAAKNQKLLED